MIDFAVAALAGQSVADLQSKLLSLVGAKYGDERFQPADCYGFVRHCYALAGVALPKNIWQTRHLFAELPRDARWAHHILRLLDVVYFRDFLLEERHVGIVLDHLYILQSSHMTNGVAALRLHRPGVIEQISGIYRLK